MAKWWPFGRSKGKDDGQAPAPTPAPTPAPHQGPPVEQPGERHGMFGRLFGRRRKKEPEPEPPAAPKPPQAPATPEQAPPPVKPARQYPAFLHVEATGVWVISDTEWEGTMSGTLHGRDVKAFIDAMEKEGGPDYATAIPLIADAYGIPGGLINMRDSVVQSVTY